MLHMLAVFRPAFRARGIGAAAVVTVALFILHFAMIASYVGYGIGIRIIADMGFMLAVLHTAFGARSIHTAAVVRIAFLIEYSAVAAGCVGNRIRGRDWCGIRCGIRCF